MQTALDTNVMAYAEGLNDTHRKSLALRVLKRLPPGSVYVPTQALGELFLVLVNKGGFSPSGARLVILRWCDQYPQVETSQAVLLAAMELCLQHRLRIWDAIMLSAASSAGCRLLLSEDLQDGFTWNGVTVVNPFSKVPHELLTELLES